MRRLGALLAIGAALGLSTGTGTAQATLPLPHVGPKMHAFGPKMHAFGFSVGTSVRTVRIPGRASVFHLNIITVDGSDGTLYAEGHDGANTVTLYGHGVILRFVQRGRIATIIAVGVRRERVVVRYWLS